MLFSSTEFLFLFLPSLLLLYSLPRHSPALRWRNGVLLLFSLAFYAWGEPVFVFIMVFFTLLNWLFGLKIAQGKKKRFWLTLTVYLDVSLLFVFKYISFVTENLAKLTGVERLRVEIALPIGISFFTFQMISYIIDVYREPSTVQKNPLYVLLYIALFPQLIAGPIVRYHQVAAEITERRTSFENVAAGTRRFIYGLGKKVLLANFLGQVADNMFLLQSNGLSVAAAWLGALAYTLQIYFDFSGYSDMAIGLGLMFGFHFPENFRFPYCSASVTEFWRRWHISLSSWFRDYVYIPMGGNRVGKCRWMWNLFAVWFLTGLWHGANWQFILWGLIYFVVLLAEKQIGLPEKFRSAPSLLLAHLYTMLIVIMAWVIFRAPDVGSGLRYCGNMLGLGSNGLVDVNAVLCLQGTYTVFLAGLVGATPLVSKCFDALKRKNILWAEPLWLLTVFFLSVLEAINSTYNPFIYFNF